MVAIYLRLCVTDDSDRTYVNDGYGDGTRLARARVTGLQAGGSACNLRTLDDGKVERVSMDRSQ